MIRWLLASARRDPVRAIDTRLEELVVTGVCPCGCASIDFEVGDDTGNASVAADAIAVWPDGKAAGLILWTRDGRIAALEVYDIASRVISSLPGGRCYDGSGIWPLADFLVTTGSGMRRSRLSAQEKKLYSRCDEVLHYLWDPIGVAGAPGARDEYDRYVDRAFILLLQGASAEEIASYLLAAEANEIGLSGSEERANRIATILIDWRDWIYALHGVPEPHDSR